MVGQETTNDETLGKETWGGRKMPTWIPIDQEGPKPPEEDPYRTVKGKPRSAIETRGDTNGTKGDLVSHASSYRPRTDLDVSA